MPKLLQTGLEIAQRRHNIFISAETFSKIDPKGLEELSKYLSDWDSTTIIVYYRRYYDWIHSLYNQHIKYRTLKRPGQWRTSLADYLEKSVRGGGFDYAYTARLVTRLRKYFENITIVNLHDKSKEFSEHFFCDAMPGAKNTCQFIKNDNKTQHLNSSVDLVYINLAFAARQMGLLRIATDEELKTVSAVVRKHHEQTLGRTINDFKLICPPAKMLEMILNKSLQYEKSIFPKLDEAVLRSDFEKQSTTLLCDVDIVGTLKMPEWQLFFKSLKNN